jgi:predicted nucleotidyltransferase component of viral defense system
MKEYLAQIVREAPTPVHGRNMAREYLQARILGVLQRIGMMIPLAFHGGTALRFLFSTTRYSEDLDFALEQPGAKYDFRACLKAIQAAFVAEGYNVDLKVSDRKAVHDAFVRFRGLPYELGLSRRKEETLAVKIEVDTNPPQGAVLATTVVRRHITLQLQHHDRASLLAGKLHAILHRPYVKGRDLYDLLWYLSDPSWPAPNLTMLNNALKQTGWNERPLEPDSWKEIVRQRLQTMAWEQVSGDVRPFLEQGSDPNLLTLDNLLRVIG